jgi:hypothetical protein
MEQTLANNSQFAAKFERQSRKGRTRTDTDSPNVESVLADAKFIDASDSQRLKHPIGIPSISPEIPIHIPIYAVTIPLESPKY